jgi:hypothetical protein
MTLSKSRGEANLKSPRGRICSGPPHHAAEKAGRFEAVKNGRRRDLQNRDRLRTAWTGFTCLEKPGGMRYFNAVKHQVGK